MTPDPKKCSCGKDPRKCYDTHEGKWFYWCQDCNKRTPGHTNRKRAVESWNKMV